MREAAILNWCQCPTYVLFIIKYCKLVVTPYFKKNVALIGNGILNWWFSRAKLAEYTFIHILIADPCNFTVLCYTSAVLWTLHKDCALIIRAIIYPHILSVSKVLMCIIHCLSVWSSLPLVSCPSIVAYWLKVNRVEPQLRTPELQTDWSTTHLIWNCSQAGVDPFRPPPKKKKKGKYSIVLR